jgi:adenosine deaminase
VATPADAFDRLPKVELHCHVEGTMRPATVVELARRNGVALPTADPTLLYQFDSLDSFLAVFLAGAVDPRDPRRLGPSGL